MSKRQAEEHSLPDSKSAAYGDESSRRRATDPDDGGMGEFEDAWEDEEEEEEEVVIDRGNDDMEVCGEEDEHDKGVGEDESLEGVDKRDDYKVYLPGQALESDEVLEADQTAYEMLHNLNVQWPCLSFDVLEDRLGEERKVFPATAYVVAGTQADTPRNNEVLVMKMSQLHRTQHDNGDSDADDDDDDGLDEDPILEHRSLRHNGGVNRVRVMPQQQDHQIAATWAETGKVHIWDLMPLIRSLDTPGAPTPKKAAQPIFTVESHGRNEGFAMDWSFLDSGRLLTGDINKNIYLTLPIQSGFQPDLVPFRGHLSSVEDLQWSPTEKNVFASCSADQTVRIWDTRQKNNNQLKITASETDVNVISWNKKVAYLLASGGDDGIFSIWDLRTFSNTNSSPTPVATFKWHSGPITSIEWHPTEESVIAVAGTDDQISIWDLSVEPDTEEDGQVTPQGVEVPPQLLFVHQGQKDIKELHWHRQIPGCVISTALTGFNIFKTISV